MNNHITAVSVEVCKDLDTMEKHFKNKNQKLVIGVTAAMQQLF